MGDKAVGIVVQGVENQLREAAQPIQDMKRLVQEGYSALPSDVQRVLGPVKEGIQTVGGWLGSGVAMFERVGETVGTYVRRKTRDDWGVPQGHAQDLGDLTGVAVSFLGADVAMRGTGRAFTAAKAGANALRRAEFLSAFEGAGSGSGPLLRTQVGAVRIGTAAEVSEVGASNSVTPTLQALSLESGPKTQTLMQQKIAAGEWRVVDGRTIRPGQEWKTLIHGRGQKTKTPGHAMESAKVGIQMAKSGEYQAVHLDRGYHRILRDAGHDIKLPVNRRPDVVGTKHGGREFDVVEVRSKSDLPVDLTTRNLQVRDQLQTAGIKVNKPKVKEIPTWDYENGRPKQ